MEEVCKEFKKKLSRKLEWYKVYADDLVLISSYKNIEEVINSVIEISKCYNLIINKTKSAILAIKCHNKID